MEHFAKWSVVAIMLWSTVRWLHILVKLNQVKHAAGWVIGILLNVWIVVAVMVWWHP